MTDNTPTTPTTPPVRSSFGWLPDRGHWQWNLDQYFQAADPLELLDRNQLMQVRLKVEARSLTLVALQAGHSWDAITQARFNDYNLELVEEFRWGILREPDPEIAAAARAYLPENHDTHDTPDGE